MNSPADPNVPLADPYRPPEVPAKPEAPPGEMQYVRAWTFVFDSSQWVVTLLFTSIASLVPVLGMILLIGYQFEVVEGLHRNRGRTYPDFDLDRFADYLVRGVWVFLVTLAAGLLLTPVFLVLGLGGTVGLAMAASAAGQDAAGAVMAVGISVLVLLALLISFLLTLAMVPMVLRAGLAQDFAAAFHFDWIKSFISKTWIEVLLGTLFLMVSGAVVVMLGMLACYVGMFPATALAMLAQAYFYFQYYELFLQRGGEPVPLKNPTQTGW